MKRSFYGGPFTWIVLGLLMTSSSGGASGVDGLLDSLPSVDKQAAVAALNFLPANQRQGLLDYLAVIGVQASGAQNVGIRAFNAKKLAENACFKELTARFYADVMIETRRQVKKRGFEALGNKPSIQSSVTDLGEKPGWLWEKALRFSKGDKLLAIQMIGVCGHDDTSQLDEAIELSKSYLENLRKSPETAELMGPLTKEEMRAILNSLPADLQKEVTSNPTILETVIETTRPSEQISCPSSASAMYYPKALGDSYDLSPALKERIARVQAPEKGASVLPAKAYHVMGAAFSACHLIRRNIPHFIADRIVKGAINAYRSSRICEKIIFANSVFSGDKSVDQLLEDFKKVRANPTDCYTKTEQGDNSVIFDYKQGAPSYCAIGAHLGIHLVEDKEITDEILRRKIVRGLAEADAAHFFRESPYAQKSNRCQGPQLTTAVRQFLAENGESGKKNPCPKDFPGGRCREARKVMETYLVDFEWSEAQHMAGLQFAKDNCSGYDPANPPEKKACDVLGEPWENHVSPSPAKNDGKKSEGIK